MLLLKVATVIASDSDAIQTKPQLQSLSLDGFALLAMTAGAFPFTKKRSCARLDFRLPRLVE